LVPYSGHNQRRVLGECFLHIHRHRQRVVIDLDRLRRRLGLLELVGNDEGDGIADVAYDVADQDRMHRKFRIMSRQPAGPCPCTAGRQSLDVRGGQDQPHAGQGLDARQVATLIRACAMVERRTQARSVPSGV